MNDIIMAILAGEVFAVVGVSANREKYGNRVWRRLRESGKVAYPVNPNASVIEGEKSYPTLADLPEVPHTVVAVVPASVTETLPEQLSRLGIRYLWMQPGAESEAAVAETKRWGIEAVYGGPCLLVELRPSAKHPA